MVSTTNRSTNAALIAGVFLLFLSTAVMIAAKMIQLFLFADLSTGLLVQTDFSNLLDWVAAGSAVLILASGALALAPFWNRGKSEAGPSSPIVAVGLLLAAACFLVQCVQDIMAGLPEGNGLLIDIGVMLFGFLSALEMLYTAVRVWSRRAGSFGAQITLILWNLLLVVRVLFTASDVVSFQSGTVKTMAICLFLLYQYGYMRDYTGEGGRWRLRIRRYVRLITPWLLLAVTVPYLVAGAAGIADSQQSMPYWAMLGAGIGALGNLVQMCREADSPFSAEEPAEEETAETGPLE